MLYNVLSSTTYEPLGQRRPSELFIAYMLYVIFLIHAVRGRFACALAAATLRNQFY
jgi:hypothetical protein